MRRTTLSPKKQRDKRPLARGGTKSNQRSELVPHKRPGPVDLSLRSTPDLIEAVRQGLPFRELEKLQGKLQLSDVGLGARLGIARATLQRRKASGRLTSEESEKIVRFARVFRQAAETVGDAEGARQWLSSPQTGLGGSIPLDYARTEVGVREVENLLGRMEYGVYA